MLFSIAQKNYLKINLIKQIKDFYNDTFKTLQKKKKLKIIDDGKFVPALGLAELIL